MFAVAAFFLAQTQAPLELQYSGAFDKALLTYKVPLRDQISKLELKFLSLEKISKARDMQVLEIEAGMCAPLFFHVAKYQGTYRERMLKWLKKNTPNLRDGAEKEVILHTFLNQETLTMPDTWSDKAIRQSPIIAYAVIEAFRGRPCRTEGQLVKLRQAIASFGNLPPNKYYKVSHEGLYQMGCYHVRNDFKALRKALDLFYEAAKIDPRPGAVEQAKKWGELWEKHLKDNGY